MPKDLSLMSGWKIDYADPSDLVAEVTRELEVEINKRDKTIKRLKATVKELRKKCAGLEKDVVALMCTTQ
jgi:hypothetical protein